MHQSCHSRPQKWMRHSLAQPWLTVCSTTRKHLLTLQVSNGWVVNPAAVSVVNDAWRRCLFVVCMQMCWHSHWLQFKGTLSKFGTVWLTNLDIQYMLFVRCTLYFIRLHTLYSLTSSTAATLAHCTPKRAVVRIHAYNTRYAYLFFSEIYVHNSPSSPGVLRPSPGVTNNRIDGAVNRNKS